jgi:NADH:ubiquinone oxidoreductase subunit 5 (subunit L)/multisubunit Na+/H+ antiporter MnhA subunit
MTVLLWVILLPVLYGVGVFLIPKRVKYVRELITIVGTGISLALAIWLLIGVKEATLNLNWFNWGQLDINFDLRLYAFSRFILVAAAGFAFLVSVYSWKPLGNHPRANEFYAYLLVTLGATNGAVLANNFVLLIVFWETLLIITYLFITLGKNDAYKTATKSLVLLGISDFLLILGIGLLWHLNQTMTMTMTVPQTTTGLAGVAFVLMMIGASAKAGAMPFHAWIPDAAIDAPLPFMAFLPAALEKLLGIYLLGRIGLDFFRLNHSMQIVTMTLGAATILFPVFAALVQKDYKKLLSFHAISQVGYMVLGIGTNVAIGVAGGIWHMLNHSMYKSTLFLTGGSVETQAGTTDLRKLGGLRKAMPITAICAFIAAASISGIPPFNGYFSKEFIYHGAKETGMWIFVICAMLGSTLTLLSFLKLTFSSYMGEKKPELAKVKEAPWTMTVPMLIIAAGCVLFGVYNPLPIKLFIQPLISAAGVPFAEPVDLVHHAWQVTPVTVMAMGFLLLAVAVFVIGIRRTKQAVTAVDFIHDAPVLRNIYDWSEKRYFDIYEQGVRFLHWLSGLVFRYVERTSDWIVEGVPRLAVALGERLRKAHTGLLAMYLSWIIAGLLLLLLLIGGVL